MNDFTLPIVTKGLLIFNVTIHALLFITTTGLGNLAISGQEVVVEGQYYRIVTAAFTHSGLLHIFMNMSSLAQLGSSLELQFGSIRFLLLTIWGVLLVGGAYILLALLLWYATNDMKFMLMSGVGFSGVLFMYAVLEAFHTRAESQSFFGMCSVPARMYPFLMLIVIQFMLPGISFLGHLSGVIVGLLLVYGVLEVLVLPSLEFCKGLENASWIRCLTNSRNYVRCADMNNSFAVTSSAAGGVLASLCAAVGLLLTYVQHVLVAVLYIVGCPTERLSQNCSNIGLRLRSCFSAMASSLFRRAGEESTAAEAGVALSSSSPRYARLPQTSGHGAGTETISPLAAAAAAAAAAAEEERHTTISQV